MIKKTAFLFLLFFVLSSLKLNAQNKDIAFDYSKNLEIYNNLIKTLKMSYIDTLNFSELNKTAIDALLAELDPYTVFIPEAEKESFEYVRTGKYGGVGLAIVKNENDYAYISNIMPDQPADQAGLQIGDKILRVDGYDTRKMTKKELGVIFKGTPGKPFLLSIERLGEITSVDYLLTRKNIKVRNVAFSTMLDNSIAYISLQSFTLNAANEFLSAFLDLKEENPKGLIIDLRDNGGGLIIEAVHALNVFLQRGLELVRTEGKQAKSEYIYRTQRPAVDIAIPLVFLVDDQTASAAEIMAGAAQDFDRAVLIGQNTYGKGLVQNVVPLNYDAQLKITIARFILPSGRGIKNEESQASSEVFTTLSGREVFEGKGLTPDIKMIKKVNDPQLLDQYKRLFIFEFANEYFAKQNRKEIDENFIVDDVIVDSYKQFLAERNYSYVSPTEKKVRDLRKQIENEKGQEELVNLLLQAENQQRLLSEQQSSQAVQELKNILRFEILTHKFYREGAARLCLGNDEAVQKAIEVLSDRNTYQALVRPQK
ncbi:MAG: S41 family peptidase [Bacteroidales bacterium]|nr:S41 family peptidase [Bacteroidales bacterium]